MRTVTVDSEAEPDLHLGGELDEPRRRVGRAEPLAIAKCYPCIRTGHFSEYDQDLDHNHNNDHVDDEA